MGTRAKHTLPPRKPTANVENTQAHEIQAQDWVRTMRTRRPDKPSAVAVD